MAAEIPNVTPDVLITVSKCLDFLKVPMRGNFVEGFFDCTAKIT